MTITSTYDHRIIQGAESGLFLKRVHELLLGEDDFYDDVFRSLGVPYEAVQWRRDVNPVDRDEAMLEKQIGGRHADQHAPRPRPPHRRPRPAGVERAAHAQPSSTRPPTASRSGTSTASSSPTASPARKRLPLGEILHVLRDAYCRTIGIEYMHIQEPEEKRWIQEQVEGVKTELAPDEQRHILDRLNAAEAFEKFLGKRYIGQKRFGIEGAECAIPHPRRHPRARPPTTRSTGTVLGMAHRGRLNVLANIVGKSYDQIFKEFEGDVDPDSIQGSGDVKYHLGQSGKFVSRHGDEIPVELAAEPVPPRDGRPRRRGHGPGPAGPHQPARRVLGAAAAGPRRRRVRRPGRRGRDAQPVEDQGLPRRRHDPPGHQQPARVHHAARVGPLVGVLHRRRQDGAGARSST